MICCVRQAALEAVVRGPKKKKGGAGGPVEVASEDVINIWKDRTDPVRNHARLESHY